MASVASEVGASAGGGFVSWAGALHGQPDRSHDHPTLDLPVRPRVDLTIELPLIPAILLVATAEIQFVSDVPLPHAALPRPDPGTSPPPSTRAPPLR